MSVNRSRLGWGVFLIVMGAVVLAVEVGLLGRNVTAQIVGLWPVALIVLGVGLMLRFGAAQVLGGLVVAATFGLLAGAVIAGGGRGLAGTCAGAPDAASPQVTRNGTLADGATVRMELSCVELTVDRQQSNGWGVEAQQGNGQPPVIEQTGNILQLRTPETVFVATPRRAWHVTLPNVHIGSLAITTNAATATLRLGGGSIGSLSGTLNASDGRLDLGAADLSSGSIGLTLNASALALSLPASGARDAGVTLNASSLTVCAPPELGLLISYENTLSSDNFAEAGLERVGDAWQTPGYATSTARMQLDVSANVSSTTLTRTGACP